MATLISPVKHSVTRNFRIDKRTVVTKTFVFEPGKPCDNIPDDYAKDLEATYPDKYFTPADWKKTQGAKADFQSKASEDDKVPTLEELKGKSLGDLKAIADGLGVQYGVSISGKTLAERIHTFLQAPAQDTAESTESVEPAGE